MQARRSMVGRGGTVAAEPPRAARSQFAGATVGAGRSLVAILVTAVLGALVWHSTRLPELDASVEQLLGSHSGEWEFRLATDVAEAASPHHWRSCGRPSSRGWPCGGGTRSPLP